MSSASIVATVLYALLAIICIGSNSLVCYIIMTRKLTHHVLKYYILSLSFTDLFVGFFSIPLYTTFLTNTVPVNDSSKIYQRVYTGLDITWGASSIFHLCLMSIDRAAAITNPLFHRTYMQEKSFVVKLLAVPWLMALACAIPSFIKLGLPHYSVVIPQITFVLPTAMIIICYICIFVAIRRRNVANDARQINERKLLRTVVLVVVIFMVCWVPFHVFNILYGLKSLGLTLAEMDIALRVFKFLHYLNSACNPFIYAFFHPNFRAPMLAVLRKCFDCKKEAVKRSLRQNDTKRQEFADISLPRGSTNKINRPSPQRNMDSPKEDFKEIEFPRIASPRESKHVEADDLNSMRRCINQQDEEDVNQPQSYANKQEVDGNSFELGHINEAYDSTDKCEEAAKINFRKRCIDKFGEDIDCPEPCANMQEGVGNRLEMGCANEACDTRL